MPATASDLSRYGIDFVVSVTQASINSGLMEYLSYGAQPATYICILSDPQTGDWKEPISLENLLAITGGVNPFTIPNGTPYNDDLIGLLVNHGFVCGMKIQAGIPPGVMSSDLPVPILVLGGGINVRFNMYCSQFSVIWNNGESWRVFDQPTGSPCYAETTVSLVSQSLSLSLETTYFNNNPGKKAQIISSLSHLSGSTFSLQQLLLDLESAVMEGIHRPSGMPRFAAMPKVGRALYENFISMYSNNVKKKGMPPIFVHAVSNAQGSKLPPALWSSSWQLESSDRGRGTAPVDIDASQLNLTSMTWAVSEPVDSTTGALIPSLSPLQRDVTTLNFICAINSHPLPVLPTESPVFPWNWVEPIERDVESGVLSIRRGIIAEYFRQHLDIIVPRACFKPSAKVTAKLTNITYVGNLSPGGKPQTSEVTASGPHVIHIQWHDDASSSNSYLVSYGQLTISTDYNCDVYFHGNEITIIQHLVIVVECTSEIIEETIRIVDKLLTDIYTISVDQNGSLQTSQPQSSVQDSSETPNLNAIINLFVGINGVISNIQQKATSYTNIGLQSVNFQALQAFVFPAGKAFTYKDVTISNHQDFICEITYITPNSGQNPPTNDTNGDIPTPTIPTNHDNNPTPTPTTPVTSTMKLIYSSEMMHNYIQGEIVSAQGKFVALQKNDGHALLFSTDTDKVLNVIEEQNGQTTTGWVTKDLSSAGIALHMPGATVRTFNGGQSVLDGSIGLAMAVSLNGEDRLFISLSNSSADPSWISNPTWTVCPFDAPPMHSEGQPATIEIQSILFAETMEMKQYLIVDITRPGETVDVVGHIARYYVDPSKADGSYWTQHDVPVDIETGPYSSCVGRVMNAQSDGVYTSGKAGNSGQLVYVPIINRFGVAPPTATRLTLPGGAVPVAIAASRNNDNATRLHGTTDLYAVSGSTLYRFSAEAQIQDGAIAQPLVTNSVLASTDELKAMTHDGVTTIWGKNSSNQVYYLSCTTAQLDLPSSWTYPVPLLIGIEHMSTFINRRDGGNTVFAAGNGKLQKLFQANDSSKLWQAQEIHLAAPPRERPLSFTSYTTMIQAVDEHGVALNKGEITISAKSRSPVYINGIYYVLQQTPITVVTEVNGSITVIEAIGSVNGTILIVTLAGSDTIHIDPMATPFKKLTALASKDALMGAFVPTNVVAGGRLGSAGTRPLVPPSTSDGSARAVASQLSKLKTVFNGLTLARKNRLAAVDDVAPLSSMSIHASLRGIEPIVIAIGDLFQHLRSGVDAAIQLIEDVVSGIWHFVATIAGKSYTAILDSYESVVGAAEWLFKVIKTGIKDIIDYLKFLFDWDDIRRTKDVMHTVIDLFMDKMLQDVHSVQASFNSQITQAEEALNQWAGIQDWSPLGNLINKPAKASISNPAEGQTPTSMMLANHFRNQSSNISVVGDLPAMNITQSLIDDLLSALSREEAVLGAVANQFHQLAIDFPLLTIDQVLRRFTAIILNGVLSSVQVVVDTLLRVLIDFGNGTKALLAIKLHIPIISDILNDIGISDISFSDLFLWIGSVAHTVLYKIVHGSAPFPNQDTADRIISARNWTEMNELFTQRAPGSRFKLLDNSLDPRKLDPRPVVPISFEIFVAGHHFCGVMALVGAFINVKEVQLDDGVESIWSTLSTVVGVIGGISQAGANFWLPPYPLENLGINYFMGAVTGITLFSKVAFSGFAQTRSATLRVPQARKIGANVNAILAILSIIGTGVHLDELKTKPVGSYRSAAIVGEVSNICDYISRVAYANVVSRPPSEEKLIAIAVMGGAQLLVGVFQISEANLLW